MDVVTVTDLHKHYGDVRPSTLLTCRTWGCAAAAPGIPGTPLADDRK
ncbi:hypothetical protein ACWEQV_05090 [Rhodococcus aetherivorans]|uniref:Uncharacterized protein n=1 Tax=Rhodococcus aetherivorans TaxID=191292 RepID=A0AA46PI39_9NOCA|nr:hypothetical protein [Rhodococcus aetherivorans]UGQ41550.1 hypothetical protein LRQ66_26200 [Rhodococcus aetherivorans]UYF94659.1 hypothetical protein OCS65_02460 [Rhodococcus aetherivorans]